MSFASLGLLPSLVRAVAAHGLVQPTPIQAEAIPAVLAGRDVQAAAQTGSGKTVAFAVPLLQRLRPSAAHRSARAPQGLVLVPTRELAVQIGEVLRAVAAELDEPWKIAVVFGGVSINPQMMGLRGGADIVVATPGRLLDLVEHNAIVLGQVAVLVLDEADRLLDAGFADEWARIHALLPPTRQQLFFSATFAPAVVALADGLLRDPLRIDVRPEVKAGEAPADRTRGIESDGESNGESDGESDAERDGAPHIVQRAIQVDSSRRTALLRHLMEHGGWSRVLVFVATKYSTEHVAGKLCKAGISAAAWHGELSQGARTRVLADFKAGRLQVVVATDLAARGLDIVDLPVVVNHDLPRSADDHVHRIGRTGRAGASGLAVSFICADSAAAEAHFRLIEKRQGQRVAREQVAGFEPSEVAAAPPSNGGVKGLRKSKKDKLREAAARDTDPS